MSAGPGTGIGRWKWAGVCLLAAVAQASVCPAAGAQNSGKDDIKINLPFEDWMAAGDRSEFPWKVRVRPPILRMDQRQMVSAVVEISGKELGKRGARHELFLLAKWMDPQGTWSQDYASVRHLVESKLPKNSLLQINVQALVRPGEYILGLALMDSTTGQHNVARKKFSVLPLRNDPLPGADRSVPAVEFLQETSGSSAGDQFPGASRLWLPVEIRQALRVEILANFSASEGLAGSRRAQQINLATLLPVVQLLAQLQFSSATLRVTGLDLVRRRVIFDQNPVLVFDWAKLVEAAAQINASTIPVKALEGRKQNAAFFREELAERLGETPEVPETPGNGESAHAAGPLRIFIVLSSFAQFAQGADLKPIQASADCRCRVYYFQFGMVRGLQPWDELGKVLKPLRPRKFEVFSPQDFRRALAEMLRELRAL